MVVWGRKRTRNASGYCRDFDLDVDSKELVRASLDVASHRVWGFIVNFDIVFLTLVDADVVVEEGEIDQSSFRD